MADVKQAFGTSTALLITLASLATGAARESAVVDNSGDRFLDALVRIQVRLQTGTPSTDKAVYVYAYGSEDGTAYTDNATGSNASVTMRVPTNFKLLGTIATPDAGGLIYISHPMSVATAFGGIMPRKWGVVIQNVTGLTFSALEADHAKAYTGIYAVTV